MLISCLVSYKKKRLFTVAMSKALRSLVSQNMILKIGDVLLISRNEVLTMFVSIIVPLMDIFLLGTQ